MRPKWWGRYIVVAEGDRGEKLLGFDDESVKLSVLESNVHAAVVVTADHEYALRGIMCRQEEVLILIVEAELHEIN